VASACGGLLIGLVHFLVSTLLLGGTLTSQLPSIVLGCLAGFFGSLVDSFCGAWLEYSGHNPQDNYVYSKPQKGLSHVTGLGLIDGNTTNFLSIAITAIVMGGGLAPYIYIQWSRNEIRLAKHGYCVRIVNVWPSHFMSSVVPATERELCLQQASAFIQSI